MGHALEINSDNFKTEIESDGGVTIVDFGAEWCGPCKALAPVIEELAQEYSGKVKIGKCDVDESSDLAARFGIMSVPTVLFFKGGEKVDAIMGNQPKATLQGKIDALLGG